MGKCEASFGKWKKEKKMIKECNVMIFTETWLNNNIPSSAIELRGRSVFRADRTAEDSGKRRGGGLCIYVNNSWCTDSTVTESHCSVHLEYLMIKCRPFYLPREFSAIVVTAVYIPPDANAKLAMEELHAAISKQQSTHPEGAIIVAGDFNHSNLKSVLPKFHRNVSCSTRGDKTLDQIINFEEVDANLANILNHLETYQCQLDPTACVELDIGPPEVFKGSGMEKLMLDL
ncbi:hypothetical protein HF521_003444 [Silurus meridionalis]|uniref:Endonuclease/exonuclease/phosphatase domain-containing protein n=1 Tax=Silurus meridionalis TaxID=175797 RepID=A0A8T0B802_SILME|nr:hypothetical protein HF521_003444 [Silurus meridionalis]